MKKNDPIGAAIWDFHEKKHDENIIVSSDLLDDDVLNVEHLFRKYENFPSIEKAAMQRCEGRILDIGAAAGPHASYLYEQGFDVSTIEISEGANRHLRTILPECTHHFGSVMDLKDETYDTLLILMNGAGMIGSLHQVTPFFKHLSTLLSPNGKILCDSTDVRYLYVDDDGGMWVDLNARYYGEFSFKMKYKEHETDWFDWVYIDLDNLEMCANEAGFNLEVIERTDEYSYLVELKKL